MDWIDISVPIRNGMVVYEGDPDVRIERASDLSQGDASTVSRAELGLHSGTHVDAPVHFIEGGEGVEALSPEVLMGPCVVVDATWLEADISRDGLASLAIPDGVTRVLFKTRNSRLWDLDHFSSDYIGLTEGAARELVARGVNLVGIDYLSVAPNDDPAPTHVVLLGAGIVILEGLDLRGVHPGSYELICLPLRIPGSDGAPARALVRPF